MIRRIDKDAEKGKGNAWPEEHTALLGGVSCSSLWLSSRISPQKKLRNLEFDGGIDLNSSTRPPADKPQDADYRDALSDELENLIMARVPRSESWKFCFINKRCLSLLKSGDLYKIRRENGIRESSVFVLAGGESCWWEFDQDFKLCRKLPILQADFCFTAGDKETLCAGNHLLVSGKELEGVVIWRYDLATNKWYKGPCMMNPRCLFASATCGNFAYVAGGMGSDKQILNSAEKYNPDEKSWDYLPAMKHKRKSCSGFYMDKKFFVIGGRDENGNDLTCGEAFDEEKNRWEVIPDMLRGVPVSSSQSPPLVAVVQNQLYSLETSSNELKVYLKQSNTWRNLGRVPVRADFNRGWGVAFKSLGDELLVIGEAVDASYAGHGMSIYTCCPDLDAKELQWKPLGRGGNQGSHFILNCSVMAT